MSHQLDHHLATPLKHAKDRCALFCQGAAATVAFESASTSFAALVLHHLRLAFVARYHLGFVALHLV
jgi:hypothetical protein